MEKYDFGEKKEEMGMPVWQSPKYLQSKEKAIEMIESEQYKGIIKPSDFWILMNKSKNNKMIYSGLIISHNGCLKINDTLPKEQKFNPQCFSIVEDNYSNGLLAMYVDDELVEFGEVTPSNCKNDYPYAMLLKRTFDRVVLKKSKLAYYGVYSDSEADEFKEPINDDETSKLSIEYTKLRTQLNELGCNFRDEKINEWICQKAKISTQNLTDLSNEDLKKLCKVYKSMIAKKKEEETNKNNERIIQEAGGF